MSLYSVNTVPSNIVPMDLSPECSGKAVAGLSP